MSCLQCQAVGDMETYDLGWISLIYWSHENETTPKYYSEVKAIGWWLMAWALLFDFLMHRNENASLPRMDYSNTQKNKPLHLLEFTIHHNNMIVELSSITLHSILDGKFGIGTQNLHLNHSISEKSVHPHFPLKCSRHHVKPGIISWESSLHKKFGFGTWV